VLDLSEVDLCDSAAVLGLKGVLEHRRRAGRQAWIIRLTGPVRYGSNRGGCSMRETPGLAVRDGSVSSRPPMPRFSRSCAWEGHMPGASPGPGFFGRPSGPNCLRLFLRKERLPDHPSRLMSSQPTAVSSRRLLAN